MAVPIHASALLLCDGRVFWVMLKQVPAVCLYFVDEAGDLTVFGRRGRILVGQPGVSLAFMIGICEIPDPAAVATALTELRAAISTDPYYKGVPSIQPGGRKTGLSFHAKDDLPEVRREVYRLIPSFKPKIIVAVRRKPALVALGNGGTRITEQSIYDDTISRTGKTLMHRADRIRVVVAKRGTTTSNAAIMAALKKGRDDFNRKWKTSHNQPIDIVVGAPSDHPGLQVTDYLLWALQRMLVRREERYFAAVADHFSLVHDVDDVRAKAYGRFYTRKAPMTLQELLPLAAG
jgi:hypothetical protein